MGFERRACEKKKRVLRGASHKNKGKGGSGNIFW